MYESQHPINRTSTGGAGYRFHNGVELKDIAVTNVSIALASEYNADSGFLSLAHTEAGKPSDGNFLTAPVDLSGYTDR